MKKKVGTSILYLVAFFWAFMTFFPLVITFMSSLKDNTEIMISMFALPDKWLWSNYIEAVRSADMGRAVLNSVFIAVTSTLLTLVIGMMAAYVLSRKQFKIKKWVYSLFIVGVMVPVHCTIIPISGMATATGGKNTYWFLILVYVTFNLPQAIFLFTGFLNNIGTELDEVARIDGCNDVQLLIKVLAPISIPIISTVSVLSFVWGYGELIFSMVLISDPKLYNISRGMLTFQGAYQTNFGPLFAAIVLAVFPIIAFYIIFHEKVQAGMLAGAIKG